MCKVLACFVSFCAFATVIADPVVHTLKSELSGKPIDWSSPLSYADGKKPSTGDYVTIPENMEAKLSPQDETSWNFVTNTIARIRPVAPTSHLVIDVPKNVVAEFPCEVTIAAMNSSEYYDKGSLTKTGDGELKLSAPSQHSYFAVMIVSNGTLSLQKNTLGDSKLKFYYDELRVCSNAVINLPGDNDGINCRKFSGGGTIYGDQGAKLQTLSNQDVKSVFHGKFTGFSGESNVQFLNIASDVELWATNSTVTRPTRVFGALRDTIETGAALGLAFFPKSSDDTTAIGARRSLVQLGYDTETGGGIRYLGRGETVSNFTFNARGSAVGSFVFLDAGMYGGLDITNCIFETGEKSAAMHREFILTGTGLHTNTFHCWLRERAHADKNLWCPIHLVKRGECTWRIHDYREYTNPPLTGGVSVENGTLQYDTIASAGKLCSLGLATNLYEAYTGDLDPSRKVNWAISLGTPAGTQGTIEYTGSEDVFITKRIIALRGDGRILHNQDKMFRYNGIVSSGNNAKVLTLDGEGASTKQISGLSDADGGKISITKKGSGLWELLPDVSFRGDLSVEEGSLNLVSPTYTWFRFVNQQVYTNENINVKEQPSKTFYTREMAFLSEEGISQSIGMQFVENWRDIKPGEFSYAKDASYHVNTDGEWNAFFDDTTKYVNVELNKPPVEDDESSWMPLVFRMPLGSDPVTGFDMVWNTSNTGKGACYHPAQFKIEASIDGSTWVEVFSTNNVVGPGFNSWLSDKASYSGGSLTDALTDESKRRRGFVFEQLVDERKIKLNGFVSVKSGAVLNSCGGKLDISSFQIDMTSGGGTVNGFYFTETGTLSIVNLPEDAGNGSVASFIPVNCTGVENISNWAVMVNGEESSKHSVKVSSNGEIRVTKPAMRVIIR